MKQTPLLFILAAFAFSFQSTSAQNTTPYWSLNGNSNASATSKLGTTNSVPLRLLTNNTTRLYISPSVGLVGIGTTTPKSKLAIVNTGSQPAAIWVSASGRPLFTGFSESTSGTADFMVAMASNSAGARPIFLGRRSRGTLAAPTIVSNKDYLLSLRATAYDGSVFQNAASIDFLVDGTPAAGRVPSRISFGTGSNGSNKAERLSIASNGDISFNSGQLFVQKATGSVGIGATHLSSDTKLTVRSDSNAIFGISPQNSTDDTFGPGFGVAGSGRIGVAGSGHIGVQGIGEIGYSGSGGNEEGIGVYGNGTYFGVQGYSLGTGVFGNADGTGVYGGGEVQGVYADGGRYGLVAQGDDVAVQGFAGGYGYGANFVSDQGDGLHARAGADKNSFAGVFSGNVYASGVFQSSDKNLKQNVKEFQDAMSIINKLKPRNYEFKMDSKLAVLHLPKGNHYGLIAQDVEEVLPDLVKEVHQDLTPFDTTRFNPKAIQKQKTERPAKEMLTTKAVNYTELIPIIIKGMQEQEAEIKAKDERIADLEARLSKLEALLTNGASGTPTSMSGYLEQNTPNPVSGTTTIRYHIPETATSAMLNLTDAKGQLVKTVNLSSRGTGQANLNTSMLAAGTYNYTLYVDGKPVDTKRLIITK